jgi:hypothetical protein
MYTLNLKNETYYPVLNINTKSPARLRHAGGQAPNSKSLSFVGICLPAFYLVVEFEFKRRLFVKQKRQAGDLPACRKAVQAGLLVLCILTRTPQSYFPFLFMK